MKFIDLAKTKNTHIKLDKPGKYVAFIHNISGEFIFDIESKDVDLDIFGLYVGKNADVYKVHTVQHHNAPSSTSNLLIKGVFYGESKFQHTGLIRLEKKAQKSKAYEKNQNLVLSDKAFVESEPFLEILANDVFCTHGSSTGKLNAEEIYYLGSRGLARKQAEDLLVKGFINEIVDKVEEYQKLNIKY